VKGLTPPALHKWEGGRSIVGNFWGSVTVSTDWIGSQGKKKESLKVKQDLGDISLYPTCKANRLVDWLKRVWGFGIFERKRCLGVVEEFKYSSFRELKGP